MKMVKLFWNRLMLRSFIDSTHLINPYLASSGSGGQILGSRCPGARFSWRLRVSSQLKVDVHQSYFVLMKLVATTA